MAITYDTTGKPDPILLGGNTELTDTAGDYNENTVGDIDLAMTGGLGMTAVWESRDAAGKRPRGRSCRHDVDPHALCVHQHACRSRSRRRRSRPRTSGGEQTIVGTENGAIDPVIQGYEIVDDNKRYARKWVSTWAS